MSLDNGVANMSNKTAVNSVAWGSVTGNISNQTDLVSALNTKLNGSVGSGAPTTSTVGAVGDIYVDKTTPDIYVCSAVSGSTYTWTKLS